jgi:hypothetical protein
LPYRKPVVGKTLAAEARRVIRDELSGREREREREREGEREREREREKER